MSDLSDDNQNEEQVSELLSELEKDDEMMFGSGEEEKEP